GDLVPPFHRRLDHRRAQELGAAEDEDGLPALRGLLRFLVLGLVLAEGEPRRPDAGEGGRGCGVLQKAAAGTAPDPAVVVVAIVDPAHAPPLQSGRIRAAEMPAAD